LRRLASLIASAMGKIFFLALLSSASVVSLARPWIGVVVAYAIAILTPQTIWWWDFDGIRPAYWVLLPTLVGFVVLASTEQYHFSTVRNGRIVCLLVLWAAFAMSYFFGPYVSVQGPYRFSDASWVFSTLNKIFLLCLVACVCISDLRSLKALCYTFLFSALYLVYWANDQYFWGHLIGRLQGPVDIMGVGTYSDENSFAMLFVVASPFLWCMGNALKKRIWRWVLWLTIPLTWHAIFLTASRAGLIGIAVTTLLLACRSKQKLLGAALIPVFIAFYLWQAGPLMQERAETISEFETEASATSRLEAWNAALHMIADHPLQGVGLASFGPAFPDYSAKKPREAHNALLQITAESGIVAGAMYGTILFGAIIALWKNGRRLRKAHLSGADVLLYHINEATLVSLCGWLVCSMFASLQMYEIFYFLFVITNGVLFLSRERLRTSSVARRAPSVPSMTHARARVRRASDDVAAYKA
jgi:probable O-glycosylation ligase (exosortase A-associated)